MWPGLDASHLVVGLSRRQSEGAKAIQGHHRHTVMPQLARSQPRGFVPLFLFQATHKSNAEAPVGMTIKGIGSATTIIRRKRERRSMPLVWSRPSSRSSEEGFPNSCRERAYEPSPGTAWPMISKWGRPSIGCESSHPVVFARVRLDHDAPTIAAGNAVRTSGQKRLAAESGSGGSSDGSACGPAPYVFRLAIVQKPSRS